jgi:hypothetical protein
MRKEYQKEYQEKNKEKIKERKKAYYEKNKDHSLKKSKEWAQLNRVKINEDRKGKRSEETKKYYEDNKELISERQKEYRERNKEIIKERKKEYCEKNKEKINTYYRERKKNDKLFKMKTNLRSLISVVFKRNGYTKKSKTYQILGCSFEEFKAHIESLWEPWMTWENYVLYNGELNYGWDFDHIIPTNTAETEERLVQLNHYTNLQPLCSKVNRDIKRDNIV